MSSGVWRNVKSRVLEYSRVFKVEQDDPSKKVRSRFEKKRTLRFLVGRLW